MDGRTWIDRFARQLGVEPPDPAVVDELLSLASDAAHASERLAAPLACYLVGRAGIDATTARELAAKLDLS